MSLSEKIIKFVLIATPGGGCLHCRHLQDAGFRDSQAVGAGKDMRRLVPSSSLPTRSHLEGESRQPVPGPRHLDRCAQLSQAGAWPGRQQGRRSPVSGPHSSEQFESSFVFSDNCRPGPDTPSAAGIVLRVNAHRQGRSKGMRGELPTLPNKPQHWRPERSPGACTCPLTSTWLCALLASGAEGLRRHLISN